MGMRRLEMTGFEGRMPSRLSAGWGNEVEHSGMSENDHGSELLLVLSREVIHLCGFHDVMSNGIHIQLQLPKYISRYGDATEACQ